MDYQLQMIEYKRVLLRMKKDEIEGKMDDRKRKEDQVKSQLALIDTLNKTITALKAKHEEELKGNDE